MFVDRSQIAPTWIELHERFENKSIDGRVTIQAWEIVQIRPNPKREGTSVQVHSNTWYHVTETYDEIREALFGPDTRTMEDTDA